MLSVFRGRLRSFSYKTDARTYDDVAKTAEGSGSHKGVSYSYDISTKRWSGQYECRIHRHFLDSGAEEFLSDEFTLAGHKWRLKVDAEDGLLSVFLVSNNQVRLKVHYSIILVNHQDPMRSISNGWRKVIEAGSSRGYSEIISVSEIVDRTCGFLMGDSFVLQLGLRLSVPENESLAVAECGGTRICTWTMRYIDEVGPVYLTSDDIDLGNATWNIRFPPFRVTEKGDARGAYLYCKTNTPTEAKFKLTVLNHHSDKESRCKELVFEFPSGTSGRGWANFIPKKALLDPTLGYLKDGWLTLIAHVSLTANINLPETPTTTIVSPDEKQSVTMVAGET